MTAVIDYEQLVTLLNPSWDIQVPTFMENLGKKLSWKVMENLLKIESHEILLRAEKFF